MVINNRVSDEFTMDCPNCGPSTILFVNGEMVPHGCNYEPPAVVVEVGSNGE